MPHEIFMPVRSLLIRGTRCLASCWTIERVDGGILRFTDHNEPLEVEGETFTPTGGVVATARERSSEQPQNVDVKGILFAEAITDDDLRAGKYREAKITEVVVDWRFPFAGTFGKNVYIVESTTFDNEVWQGKVSGKRLKLRQVVGQLFDRSCRWEFGDSNCGVDLGPLTFSGTVVAELEDSRRFSTDLSQDDDFFSFGRITWTSGDNDGVLQDIKSYTANVVELHVRSPSPISPGDTFEIVRGCNHLSGVNPDGTDDPSGHCKFRYDNLLNYGGFPFLPGNDRLLQTPNSK